MGHHEGKTWDVIYGTQRSQNMDLRVAQWLSEFMAGLPIYILGLGSIGLGAVFFFFFDITEVYETNVCPTKVLDLLA